MLPFLQSILAHGSMFLRPAVGVSPKQICGPAFACYQQINQPAWIFSEDGSPQTDQYLSLAREGTEKMICFESGKSA